MILKMCTLTKCTSVIFAYAIKQCHSTNNPLQVKMCVCILAGNTQPLKQFEFCFISYYLSF